MDALANKVCMNRRPVMAIGCLLAKTRLWGYLRAPCRPQEVVFDLDAASFSGDDFRMFSFKASLSAETPGQRFWGVGPATGPSCCDGLAVGIRWYTRCER